MYSQFYFHCGVIFVCGLTYLDNTHTRSHTHAHTDTHTHTHKMVNNKTVHAVYLYKRQRIMYIVLYDLHFLYISCFC